MAIYVDGPPHDYPDRQARDRQQTTSMEDAGWTVIRFGHAGDWVEIVAATQAFLEMAHDIRRWFPDWRWIMTFAVGSLIGDGS